MNLEVLVVSTDSSVRAEVTAAVAAAPGARAVFAGEGEVGAGGAAARGRLVVIDDEGRTDALDLLARVKRGRGDTRVVYIAARHSPSLERTVREAGVSFYAVKPRQQDELRRVVAVLLQR